MKTTISLTHSLTHSLTKLSLLLVVVFLTFASCQKDETALAEEPSPTALLAKGDVPPAAHEPRCNCEYQIVSVTNTNTPPTGSSYTEFSYDVLTQEQCVSYLTCTHFKYVENCDFDGYDPCADYFPSNTPKPTAWQPFNCQQVYFSNFHVTVNNVYWWLSDCGAPGVDGPYPQGEVVVRVRCKESSEITGCNTDWHVSTSMPLPYRNGTFQSNLTEPLVELEGCGCTPEVTMSY
ncbi:MAG: hypothetical protein K9J37_01965 [Saprospiraceae bacterium]|nr:hypothetical protein [Saprospiraceae bacterium]MCF8248644.1 hypothetical protein [Saprospiraceae bacterium]MCF8278866.1 hypothetical protein [Bacteroidales bacterium]MCF8310666.1 hypothetical protein [Saprospiraceae bacterium]MCF8439225.1 hypothetical protein [Saprospiraceae bacterium]